MNLMDKLYLSLDENELFYSPTTNPQKILDVGTGTGKWAIAVADKFPSGTVYGADLYPPPEDHGWEIHMRCRVSAFTPKQWTNLYKQAYQNLVPGGWIEQIEPDVKCVPVVPRLLRFYQKDTIIMPSKAINPKELYRRTLPWALGATVSKVFRGFSAEKPLNTFDTFKAAIEKAGFINVAETLYIVPVGDWNSKKTEAGEYNKAQLLADLEGYAMDFLTKFGEPKPWTWEEVQDYLGKVRMDIDEPTYHTYQLFRRVWAQKPDTAA